MRFCGFKSHSTEFLRIQSNRHSRMFLLAKVVSLPEPSSFMGFAASRPASSTTFIIFPTNRFLSALQLI